MVLWMFTFSPIAVMRKPDKGITKPWVIPHADCTITKSENWDDLFQEHSLKDFVPVYVMFGEPFCLM